MDEISKNLDVAVFFDFENIVYSLRNNYGINANFEDLMDKCKEFGRVVVARAFADWNRQSSAMIPVLMSNGFDPVYVPSFYTNQNGKQDLRKNAVDMYMAIDAMDVLHNRKNVDTIILLTGDSDFLPLVNAIRRAGNRVIAIGVDGTVSSHLAQAVEEFIFYSQVSSLPSNKFKKRPNDIYEGVAEAITKLQRENRSTVLPNVKMMMGELLGGFDEKKHSDRSGRRFQKFKEFVQEAEKRGVVQLITTGTVNEVFLADAVAVGKSGRDVKDDRSKDRGRDRKETRESSKGTAEIISLEQGFDLLVKAVQKAQNDGRSMRTSSIKGLILDQNNKFDEKKIQDEKGVTPFSRFSEFVQAAEQQGLVNLKGKSTRMEIHPVGAESAESGEPEVEVKKPKGKKDKSPSPAMDKMTKMTKLAKGQKEDFEGRQLIIESLRSFGKYPGSFLQIEAYCRQVRNERSIQLSSPKVRELLTEATRQMGILRRISPPGVSPAQYGLNDEAGLVADYLGISLQDEVVNETTGAESAADVSAEPQSEPAPIEEAKEAVEGSQEEGQMSLSVAFSLLVTAVNKAIDSGKSQKLAAIKRQIKQLEPSFLESNIDNETDEKGFKRFSDFVKAAANDGIVVTKGKGAQSEIHLIEE